MSGDGLAALSADASHLAGVSTLRIRTVASVPDGDLNEYERQLQIRCGWADSANVRQPDLLVVMVSTMDRQMGIYPGPALIGTITDPVWLSIEQENMGPLFADGDWSGGLQAGVDALDQALSVGRTAGKPARPPAPRASCPTTGTASSSKATALRNTRSSTTRMASRPAHHRMTPSPPSA
jgi:uncharacterized membrane protein YgcG